MDCLTRLRDSGAIGADEEVVVFNTGAAQKDLEVLPDADRRIDRTWPEGRIWEAIG